MSPLFPHSSPGATLLAIFAISDIAGHFGQVCKFGHIRVNIGPIRVNPSQSWAAALPCPPTPHTCCIQASGVPGTSVADGDKAESPGEPVAVSPLRAPGRPPMVASSPPVPIPQRRPRSQWETVAQDRFWVEACRHILPTCVTAGFPCARLCVALSCAWFCVFNLVLYFKIKVSVDESVSGASSAEGTDMLY